MNYNVIETTSTEAFQAICVELQSIKKSNIICGVIYRQHNSPKQFQSYFDDTLEKLSAHNKPVYITGDFNIDLLKSETCGFSHNFLLSLQSFSFVPTINKPTRMSLVLSSVYIYGRDQMRPNTTVNVMDRLGTFAEVLVLSISESFITLKIAMKLLPRRFKETQME